MTDGEWKRPERYVRGPGMPALPPQLNNFEGDTIEEVAEKLTKLPFFMTELDDADDSVEVEALRALAYDGEPDEIATNFKNQGNEMYKAKRYTDAIGYYTQALDVKCGVDSIDTASLINRAACNLELKNYRRCINDCKLALKLSPTNLKALFRSAKAYLAIEKYDECLDCVEYALTIEPENAAVKSIQINAATRRDRLRDLELRRREAKELKETKARNLEAAVKSKNITLMRSSAVDGDFENSENLRIQLEDDLNPASDLSIPLLFLYPLELESDVFQSSHQDESLATYIYQLFESAPAWFSNSAAHSTDYAIDNLQIYVQTSSGGLAKIGKKSSVLKILSMKSPVIPVIDQVARFYVVPKNRANEWLSTWDKEQASRQLLPLEN